MHQDSAHGVGSKPARLVAPAVDTEGDSYRLAVFAPEREFGGVVENKDGARAVGEPCSPVAWKSPDRMSASLTRPLDKKRYAAFVFAQSWQANGMVPPTPSQTCSSKFRNLLARRKSLNLQPALVEPVACTGRDLGQRAVTRLDSCHGAPSGAIRVLSKESQQFHSIQEFARAFRHTPSGEMW
jgi:hypothetical protein